MVSCNFGSRRERCVRAVGANLKHFKPGERVLALSNATYAELVAVNALITGALGSVGRAAVHTAKKIGAQVIAGVRGQELGDARSLGVSDVLAIDDDGAIAKSRLVDAIADAVGGEVAAKLIARVKQDGCFGYTAVLPVPGWATTGSCKPY